MGKNSFEDIYINKNEISIYRKNDYFKIGLKDGLSIAVGYIPIAITFGLLSKSLGISPVAAMMMSLLHFAAASQFIGVKLMSTSIPLWEIIFTTFMINSRYFLMSFSIAQKFPKTLPVITKALIGFGLTDETFTIASLKNEGQINLKYFLGLCLTPYLSWFLGTVIGIYVADNIPNMIKNSMDIALYAMFIGLLIPSVKKSKAALVVSLISITISACIKWLPIFNWISSGWDIILSVTIAAIIGAVLLPTERKIK